MRKAAETDEGSLIFLCGTHSLRLSSKTVRMTGHGPRVQPASPLPDSDQQQMHAKKSNSRVQMKHWFSINALPTSRKLYRLTKFHNSVAKRPPKTPLKQENPPNPPFTTEQFLSSTQPNRNGKVPH